MDDAMVRAFPPTRHSAVAAVRSADAAERARGLAILSAVYWRPVYTYLRLRWHKPHEEAADLAQEFFVQVVQRDLLARFDPSRARLRTFLRTGIDGLRASYDKAAFRKKRGGGAVPLDFDGAREEIERLEGGCDPRTCCSRRSGHAASSPSRCGGSSRSVRARASRSITRCSNGTISATRVRRTRSWRDGRRFWRSAGDGLGPRESRRGRSGPGPDAQDGRERRAGNGRVHGSGAGSRRKRERRRAQRRVLLGRDAAVDGDRRWCAGARGHLAQGDGGTPRGALSGRRGARGGRHPLSRRRRGVGLSGDPAAPRNAGGEAPSRRLGDRRRLPRRPLPHLPVHRPLKGIRRDGQWKERWAHPAPAGAAMNRIAVGILVGGALGILDGLTAWFTPEARPQMIGIVIGSTVKGLMAGAIIGAFARRVASLPWTLAFGTFVGALLAFAIAHMGGKYYLEIISPAAWSAS